MFYKLFPLFFILACPFLPADPPQDRLLLITGCSRSGTSYISDFLRLNGVQVDHEQDAPEGTVSWTMAIDAPWTPWGPGSRGYRFRHVFHQVRHPLKAIGSIVNEEQRAWDFIQSYIPQVREQDPILVRAVNYWIYWNLAAERKAELTYRIEDVEKVLPKMERILRRKLDPKLLEVVPKNTNTRHANKNYTWEDLSRGVSKDLFKKLVMLTKHYGYTKELSK